jgi:hypothetical protein
MPWTLHPLSLSLSKALAANLARGLRQAQAERTQVIGA